MLDVRAVNKEVSRTDGSKNIRFEFLGFWTLHIGYCSENNTRCQKLNLFPSKSGRVKRPSKFCWTNLSTRSLRFLQRTKTYTTSERFSCFYITTPSRPTLPSLKSYRIIGLYNICSILDRCSTYACINTSLKYNQQDASFSGSIYFYKLLYMFQAVPPPIIRSTKLYTASGIVKPILLPAGRQQYWFDNTRRCI